MDSKTIITICVVSFVFFRIAHFGFKYIRNKLESISKLKEAHKTFKFTEHSKKPLGVQKRMVNLKQYRKKSNENIQT